MCLASKVNRESEKLFSVFQERHYLIAVANEFTGYGVRLFSGFAIISKDFTGGIVKSSSISIFHNESSIVSVWAFNVLFHIFQLLFIVYYLHTEGYFYFLLFSYVLYHTDLHEEVNREVDLFRLESYGLTNRRFPLDFLDGYVVWQF
jgi:hypothetical protein